MAARFIVLRLVWSFVFGELVAMEWCAVLMDFELRLGLRLIDCLAYYFLLA